jgi:dihydrodipicolinate synthase/N-acetylneuraminate lyase
MDPDIRQKLQAGCVIPAHPLALTRSGKLDVPHQKALTRYYLDAGAGGLAVGVHTTQFALHDAKLGLYRPVLELAAQCAREHAEQSQQTPPILIAGILGPTAQAVQEAGTTRDLGYHLGLLSLTALAGKSTQELIDHARQVARVIPLMGFYLQPTISHMTLGTEFWRKFVQIPELQAIKIAPFSRYQTLDVLEAVAHSGRAEEIALYTGNDDTIITDLLTSYVFPVGSQTVTLRFVGGLLGQWACWTQRAVELLQQTKDIHAQQASIPAELMTLGAQLTRANQAIFDADNAFKGCIPGIHHVLKGQGLLHNVRTLDPQECLSPDQAERIDQVIHAYPHLTDDHFVEQHLERWLRD